MKTQPLDFLLSGTLLALLLVVALAATAFGVYPLTTRWLGPYHVLADAAAFLLFFGIVAAAAAALLLRLWPLRPGIYPMEDRVFTYWKVLTVLYEFSRGALLPFTTVFARPLVAKLLGVRIGSNVAYGGRIFDPCLVTIGDDVILGHQSTISGHAITSGKIVLHEVRIGRGATVGVNAVVLAGVEIGEGAIVAPASVVNAETRIPAWELWGGVPAKKLKDLVRPDDGAGPRT